MTDFVTPDGGTQIPLRGRLLRLVQVDAETGCWLWQGPDHLEAVTQRENSMRGDTIPARHAAKTHCANGHPLSGDNLRRDAKQRYCRTCVRETSHRYRRRKAELQAETMRKVLA